MSNSKVRARQIQKIIVWCLIALFFALLFTYSNFKKNGYIKEILEDSAFAEGSFQSLRATKSGLVGVYTFTVNEKTHSKESTNGRYKDLGQQLYQNRFPVIYSRKNPEKSKILVFSDDFEDFNMAYPDSLDWVMKMAQQ